MQDKTRPSPEDATGREAVVSAGCTRNTVWSARRRRASVSVLSAVLSLSSSSLFLIKSLGYVSVLNASEGTDTYSAESLELELAVFADETMLNKFEANHGSLARTIMELYVLSALSNVQIVYNQPAMDPQIKFRLVRFDITSQIMTFGDQNYADAHQYLAAFCNFQANHHQKQWDDALLITGRDIFTNDRAGSAPIGITPLRQMCSAAHSYSLVEGGSEGSFTIAHELGHNLGMVHDETAGCLGQQMVAALGGGAVYGNGASQCWSTCSIKSYNAFIKYLDDDKANCLRVSTGTHERELVISNKEPGTMHSANTQCEMHFGSGYEEIIYF
uniref:Peptidase M12B domain-containing protein n=1 Tax=Steinernema glaseri TaxID=37863 RepID=A0A1I7Z5X2_9BILA